VQTPLVSRGLPGEIGDFFFSPLLQVHICEYFGVFFNALDVSAEVRSAGPQYCSHIFQEKGFVVFLLAVSHLDHLTALGRFPGPLHRELSVPSCVTFPSWLCELPCREGAWLSWFFTDQNPLFDVSWSWSHELH